MTRSVVGVGAGGGIWSSAARRDGRRRRRRSTCATAGFIGQAIQALTVEAVSKLRPSGGSRTGPSRKLTPVKMNAYDRVIHTRCRAIWAAADGDERHRRRAQSAHREQRERQPRESAGVRGRREHQAAQAGRQDGDDVDTPDYPVDARPPGPQSADELPRA
jgi:hypothetical protein